MKKLVPITKLKADADIQGFYLCKEKHLRKTRSREFYLDLTLTDATGEIGAKVWDQVQEFNEKFEQGDAVAVRGRIDTFQDRNQIIVGRINKATEAKYARYGFKPEALVPVSPHDPVRMWTSLGAIIQKMENQFLKKLVSQLYRKHKDRLMSMPASISMHYTYRSGYLEHVLSMAKLGVTQAKHYSANIDMLLAGILLHGIGKVRELTDAFMPEYSDEGNFIGHSVLGRDMIREEAAEIKNFPDDLLLELEHLIMCHEGGFDSRYRNRARTKEALLLQALDNLDTKVSLFNRILDEDSEDGDWTSRRNYFGAALYKGDRP
ncbi:MAG TPA: HD domain-containing protein [Candidatus Marinimicrobia bacterium]|nr:HD domain-containing protein [Candidatus Neomarinimicrobiota bacterium]